MESTDKENTIQESAAQENRSEINTTDCQENHLVEGEPTTIEKPLVRRMVAFSIDSAIVYSIVGIVERFFPLDTSEGLLSLIPLPVFIAYFLFFEGGESNASLGKRWLKIKVSALEGGYPPFSLFLLRTFLFCFILLSYEIVNAIPMPLIFNITLSGISIGFLLYNSLLILIPNRFPLHDWAASTFVIDSKMFKEDISKREKPKMRKALWALGWVCLLPSILFNFWAINQFSFDKLSIDPWELTSSENPPSESSKVEQTVQIKLKEKYKIRSRVSVDSSINYSTQYKSGEEAVKTETKILNIQVEILSGSLDSDERDEAFQLVLDHVLVEPGYYDEGEISISTSGFFSMTYTKEINWP